MSTNLRLSAMKAAFLLPLLLLFCMPILRVDAGTATTKYSVLAPISKGKLTIFPVVAQITHDTSGFITLDDGIRSGDVIVTEAGNVGARPLVRGQSHYVPEQSSGARVNQLVLVNNSKHPLILLAGEIVTGGKQDRIIAKDRIIPAGGDPVDLSVFCVEPGRWTGTTTNFKAMSIPQMAQPSVRYNAMAEKSQQKVWDEVGRSRERALAAAPPQPDSFHGGVVGGVTSTTSYAKTMEAGSVQQTVDEVAKPIQTSYDSLIHQLRDKHAVGVTVAVNGQIIWAESSPARSFSKNTGRNLYVRTQPRLLPAIFPPSSQASKRRSSSCTRWKAHTRPSRPIPVFIARLKQQARIIVCSCCRPCCLEQVSTCTSARCLIHQLRPGSGSRLIRCGILRGLYRTETVPVAYIN